MRRAGFLNWTVLIAAVVLLLTRPVLAEFMQDVHGDRIHPGADEYYGTIDGFPESEEAGNRTLVIIDDRVLVVDEGAIFRTLFGGLTDLSSFTPGMMVHYYALGNLLTKMWPTGEMHEAAPPPSKEGRAAEEGFRFEDGVWRN